MCYAHRWPRVNACTAMREVHLDHMLFSSEIDADSASGRPIAAYGLTLRQRRGRSNYPYTAVRVVSPPSICIIIHVPFSSETDGDSADGPLIAVHSPPRVEHAGSTESRRTGQPTPKVAPTAALECHPQYSRVGVRCYGNVYYTFLFVVNVQWHCSCICS